MHSQAAFFFHDTAVEKEDTVLRAACTAAVSFNDASGDRMHQIAFFFVSSPMFLRFCWCSPQTTNKQHGQENTVRTSHIHVSSRLPAHD